MTSWQLIFLQSKVNNGGYDGDRYFDQNWVWPKETWFQLRLRGHRSGYSTKETTQQSWQ
jgi:hypothetical protein